MSQLPVFQSYGPLMGALSWIPFRVIDGHALGALPPQSSHGGLDEGDDVVVPLGTHCHLGKVLVTVAGDSKDKPGHSLLALLGVFDPRAIFFFSRPLRPSIPAAALRITQWCTCLLLMPPSLSPAVNVMATKLAFYSSPNERT